MGLTDRDEETFPWPNPTRPSMLSRRASKIFTGREKGDKSNLDQFSFQQSPAAHWLEPRVVDLQPQPVLPDQLVVGEAPLQVLTDHVNVLEVALHQVALVDRRCASGIIDGVDDLDRQSNRVRLLQTEVKSISTLESSRS